MQTGLEEIKAGDKYPGWEKPFENSLMGIMDGEIQLLVSLPYPREIDIEDFKNLTAYGIYNEKYPLAIWRFGKNFLLPTPYNPEFEKQFKPNDVEKFICQKNRIMTRILIDQNGIIRVISLAELKSGFIEDLQKAWSNSKTDWGGYNDKNIKIARYSINFCDLRSNKSDPNLCAYLWKLIRPRS
jgi:hypothetical protein